MSLVDFTMKKNDVIFREGESRRGEKGGEIERGGLGGSEEMSGRMDRVVVC